MWMGGVGGIPLIGNINKIQNNIETLGFTELNLPNFRFMFLEDIDPLFKIFKNLLGDSSGVFGTRLFQHFRKHDFHDFAISTHKIP